MVQHSWPVFPGCSPAREEKAASPAGQWPACLFPQDRQTFARAFSPNLPLGGRAFGRGPRVKEIARPHAGMSKTDRTAPAAFKKFHKPLFAALKYSATASRLLAASSLPKSYISCILSTFLSRRLISTSLDGRITNIFFSFANSFTLSNWRLLTCCFLRGIQ